ncbi:hypothetical protein ACET3Z_008224 [Daucus carota]
MAAKSLRCVVIAYKKCEMDKVLKDEKHMAEWVLPEDDLVWNAYVGIKNQDSEFNLAVFNQNVIQRCQSNHWLRFNMRRKRRRESWLRRGGVSAILVLE